MRILIVILLIGLIIACLGFMIAIALNETKDYEE